MIGREGELRLVESFLAEARPGTHGESPGRDHACAAANAPQCVRSRTRSLAMAGRVLRGTARRSRANR